MLRPTLHFFLICAGLLALRVGWEIVGPVERPRIEVVVPANATGAEVRALVDREIIAAEAVRQGWISTDPVIRRQLVSNMRFVGGGEGSEGVAEPEEVLLERAQALGMHRTDPVVRQRLTSRISLHADLEARRYQPSEAELREHLERHPDRFSLPARYRLSLIFLSRQRRDEALTADARTLADRLELEGVDPLEAYRLGDPLPQSPAELTATASVLDRRFGPGFGQAIVTAIPGRWEGPIESAYGIHFLWVHQVVPGVTPPLDEIRGRVAASLMHDRRVERHAEYMDRLRQWYQVELRHETAR